MIIGAVLALLIVGGGGYYWYSSSNDSTEISGGQAAISKDLLSPKVKAYVDAKDKIYITKKDLEFMNKELYPLLKDYSEDIPFKVPEGRPNPFVPYTP